MLISAIVLTKNEENNIDRCLRSLSWVDEVLVIDDGSIDGTASISRKHHAKVIHHALQNDFAAQRNFGLDRAKGEWVLFVDADEVVSSALREEINVVIGQSEHVGFFLKRQDVMWGRVLFHGEWGNTSLLRLGKKAKGKWVGSVHERWEISGRIGALRNPLQHFPHQSVADFIREVNYYTDLRANELLQHRVRVSLFDVVFYPKAKFFQNFILRLGFLDGMAGLVAAIIMSFHSFLVRAKLWLLWQKKK